MKMYKKAFTLAEVLITLMVIGIVAVVTIPAINQAWEERATVSKLQKTYSMLQQAFALAEINIDSVASWPNTSDTGARQMAPYLKVIKDCGKTSLGCFGGETYKNLGEQPHYAALSPSSTSYYKLLLNDGTAIAFNQSYKSFGCNLNYKVDGENSCQWVAIDLNGSKPPNRWGYDTFSFLITKKGIRPMGGKSGENTVAHTSCQKDALDGNFQTGYGCARWVIERRNMEYLNNYIAW